MRTFTLLELISSAPLEDMSLLAKAPRQNIVPQLLSIERSNQGTVRFFPENKFIEVRWEYENTQVMVTFKKSSSHKVTPSLSVSRFEGNKKFKDYVIQISNREDNPSYQYFQTVFSIIYDQAIKQ